jgi:serine phosphatase RsbU (regulator of sigma subunit)/predicted ester cyclase
MSAEDNKALVRSFYEAQAKGDLEAMKDLLAPDFVDRSVLPGQAPDREGYIQGVGEDRAAFSNIRVIIEDQAADGDKVISRIRTRGTHDRGEFMGALPIGREWETTGIAIHRITGGKIVEEWSESGGPQVLTQQRLEQEMRERELLEQELRVARRIQQALLPKAAPRFEGWHITHHYRPAREVGGDFYDFLELPGGQLGIVVGDATGHGVPAAVLMASARSVLRAVAQRGGTAPGPVLAEANDILYPDIPSNTFVTCFYGILDPSSGLFSYANAGQNLPYCRRCDGPATELRAVGMPLGLLPGMDYEDKETVLEAGDSTLFYSDGLVEAHGPEREMFGTPRLQRLLTEHATDAEDFTTFLLEELEKFMGEGREQEDDITLVTLHRSATRKSTSEKTSPRQ